MTFPDIEPALGREERKLRLERLHNLERRRQRLESEDPSVLHKAVSKIGTTWQERRLQREQTWSDTFDKGLEIGKNVLDLPSDLFNMAQYVQTSAQDAIFGAGPSSGRTIEETEEVQKDISALVKPLELFNIVPETIGAASELVEQGREALGIGPIGRSPGTPPPSPELVEKNRLQRERSQETIKDWGNIIKDPRTAGENLNKMIARHESRPWDEQVMFGIFEVGIGLGYNATRIALGFGNTPLKKALLLAASDIPTSTVKPANIPTRGFSESIIPEVTTKSPIPEGTTSRFIDDAVDPMAAPTAARAGDVPDTRTLFGEGNSSSSSPLTEFGRLVDEADETLPYGLVRNELESFTGFRAGGRAAPGGPEAGPFIIGALEDVAGGVGKVTRSSESVNEIRMALEEGSSLVKDYLRSNIGDEITLFRVSDEAADTSRKALSFTSSRSFAESLAKETGIEIQTKSVPIDDILWVTNRAGQEEFIVKTGRLKEATATRAGVDPAVSDKIPFLGDIYAFSDEPLPITTPIWEDSQDVVELLGTGSLENWARKLANLPVIKQVQRKFNPPSVMDEVDPISQFNVALSMGGQEAITKATGVWHTLTQFGNSRKVFGKIDDYGRIADGPLAGKNIHDIQTYPDRYTLTPKQRQWIDQYHAIDEVKLDFLKRNGIEVNELTFEEGGRYADRLLMGKFTKEGEILEVAQLGSGGRVGSTLPGLKQRTFTTMEEGIAAGYKYMDPEDALFYNLLGAGKAVSDKNAKEWFLTKVDVRTTATPEGFKIAVEQAKHKYDVAKNAVDALQKARLGYQIHHSTIRSIENNFPGLEGKLSEASRITLDDLVRAGEEATKPSVFLPVPHAGTLKKLAKLMEETQKRAQENPGNAIFQKEAADLRRRLGFAKYRYKLGVPFEIKQNPVKLLRGVKNAAIDDLLLIVRGKPVRFKNSVGKMATRYEGGLVGEAKILREEAEKKSASASKIAKTPTLFEGESTFFKNLIFTGDEGKELAAAVSKSLGPDTGIDALDPFVQFNAIRRMTMLAGDASHIGIQLIFLPGMDPKIAGQASLGFLRSLVDSKFHAQYLSKNQDVVQGSRNLIITANGKTEMTEAIGRGGWVDWQVTTPSGGRIKPLSPVRAVLKPFARGYETALDIAGIELKKAHGYMAMDALGTQQVDDHINAFRGLSNPARLGVSATTRQVESLSFLASRYNRGVASLMFDLAQGNIRGDLARKALGRGLTALAMMTYVIGKSRGETDKEILDHFNPLSRNFFGWEVAGQVIGVGSKARSVVKFLAEGAVDIVNLDAAALGDSSVNLLRGNASPIIQDSLDLFTGRDYLGDPTRDTPMTFTKHVAKKFMPIYAGSILMDGGDFPQRTLRGGTEFIGGRAYPFSPSKVRSEIRYEKMEEGPYELDPNLSREEQWNALKPSERYEINNTPEVQQAQEAVDDRKLKQGDAWTEYTIDKDKINETYKTQIETKFNNEGYSESLRKKIDLEWGRIRAKEQLRLREIKKDALSFLDDLDPRTGEVNEGIALYWEKLYPVDPEDPNSLGWISAETGEPDFQKRDAILEQLRLDLGPELFAEVLSELHIGEPDIVKELREDRLLLKEYFNIERNHIEEYKPHLLEAYELYINEKGSEKGFLLGTVDADGKETISPTGSPAHLFRELRRVLDRVRAGEGEYKIGPIEIDGLKVEHLKRPGGAELELLLYKWGWKTAQKPVNDSVRKILHEQRLENIKAGEFSIDKPDVADLGKEPTTNLDPNAMSGLGKEQIENLDPNAVSGFSPTLPRNR